MESGKNLMLLFRLQNVKFCVKLEAREITAGGRSHQCFCFILLGIFACFVFMFNLIFAINLASHVRHRTGGGAAPPTFMEKKN